MMCEASSKTDSTSVLWGEIQEKFYPCDAINLWKPIIEYQNVIIKHERNLDDQMNHRMISSNDSDFSSDGDEERLYHDPVGCHIIQLRKYCCELADLIHKMEEAAKKKESGKHVKINILPPPCIPEFPKEYPFSQPVDAAFKIDHKVIVKYKGSLSKGQVKKQRMFFVKKVLAQTGFHVGHSESDDLPLKYLSDVTDDFLQKFVSIMNHNRSADPFYENDDLWGSLETTLQNIGMGGISALHTFYYENVAKKHDVLLNHCMNLYDKSLYEYQKLLAMKINTRK